MISIKLRIFENDAQNDLPADQSDIKRRPFAETEFSAGGRRIVL
jgi:hypothetical protein